MRPAKDGMLHRFTVDAMNEIVKLVPNFQNEDEANKFFKHFTKLKAFKDLAEEHLEAELPTRIQFDSRVYRCTAYVRHSMDPMELLESRANPMEVLHYLAHYLQPSDSAWHKGEFGKIFLRLVGRKYGPEMKKNVTNIMVEHRLRTFARSPDSRLKQSHAFYNKKAQEVPQNLVKILADMRKLTGKDPGDG